MKKYLIEEKKYYKANLHCHSVRSDGAMTPEELKDFFLKMGYSIVAFTDHVYIEDFNSYLTDENFGPFLPFIQDDNVTDINYNGKHIWIEDLTKGRYLAVTSDTESGENVPLTLTPQFVNSFANDVEDVLKAALKQMAFM